MKPSDSKSLSPKKSLGQNFLVSEHMQDKIIQACELRQDDIVLEIGPGKGALTMKITPMVKQLFAVEKDPRMSDYLSQKEFETSVTILNEDFLKFNFDVLPAGQRIKVVGNLPYNVATPIIEKILADRRRFSSFYMTVQLEYGQRLCADINSKDYGSLSCFVQMYSDPTFLFRIKNTAFFPKPKVESCFLKLDILDQPKYDVRDEEALFRIIKMAFSQRRKTVRNALAQIVDKERLLNIFEKVGVDPKLRPENLTLKQYVEIVNLI